MVGFQIIKERIRFLKRVVMAGSCLSDAFVMVVMSHGNETGCVRTYDWQQLSIEDDLVAPFDGDHWPEMRHRPKIFLIQACRGSKKRCPDNTWE